MTIDKIRAGRDILETWHQIRQTCLAGTARSDERHHFTRIYAQLLHRGRRLAIRISEPNVIELDALRNRQASRIWLVGDTNSRSRYPNTFCEAPMACWKIA